MDSLKFINRSSFICCLTKKKHVFDDVCTFLRNVKAYTIWFPKVRFNEINVRQNINNIHNSHVLCQSANHNPRKIVMVETEIIVAQLPSSKFYQRIYRRRRLYILWFYLSRSRYQGVLPIRCIILLIRLPQ